MDLPDQIDSHSSADAGGGEIAAAPAHALLPAEENAAFTRRIRVALGSDNGRTAAARLSLDPQVVRRVLAGRRPTFEFLRRLCRVYRVDGHWLLTGEGTPDSQSRIAERLRHAPAEALMAEVARRLSPTLTPADAPCVEVALEQGQAALDSLRSELPQAP